MSSKSFLVHLAWFILFVVYLGSLSFAAPALQRRDVLVPAKEVQSLVDKALGEVQKQVNHSLAALATPSSTAVTPSVTQPVGEPTITTTDTATTSTTTTDTATMSTTSTTTTSTTATPTTTSSGTDAVTVPPVTIVTQFGPNTVVVASQGTTTTIDLATMTGAANKPGVVEMNSTSAGVVLTVSSSLLAVGVAAGCWIIL